MKKLDLLEVLEGELLKVEKDIQSFKNNNNPQSKRILLYCNRQKGYIRIYYLLYKTWQ